jgi:CRISPR-associated protein Csy1
MNKIRAEAPPTSPGVKIKTVIAQFLQDRLQAKLDKLNAGEDEAYSKLLETYQPQTWIANAAHRVEQIQQVSHALKYTHPDARGSSLNSAGNLYAGELVIGTHLIGNGKSPDVVGNAAALDVYKFLHLTFDGQTLLERAIANDPALASAFSDNAEMAREWMNAFAALAQPKGQPASHTLAKQIYWPLECGGYHLLAPLFPSTLADAIWHTVREGRFSDAAKAAREAHRADQPHPCGYRECPNLTLQKFGGSKPQNISQLNSERYGENYLIASLPPIWKSQGMRPPLHVDSVFDGPFSGRTNVRKQVDELRKFLVSVQERTNNKDIREKFDEMLTILCDELLNYAATLHDLSPGWTQSPDCRINEDEQYWLDPGRAESDAKFAARRICADWQDGIVKRFGNWLNSNFGIEKKKLRFDQYAVDHWADAVKWELALFRLDISHD